MGFDRDHAAAYFSALTAPLINSDTPYVGSVWSTPSKRARFYSDVNQAIEHAAEACAHDANTYAGVGYFSDEPSEGRGTANDVKWITSVWCDIDVADGAHSRNDLCSNTQEAISIIRAVGPKPSIIVLTGGHTGGVQAYWLLKEPLSISDGAAALARRWANTVRAVANAHSNKHADVVGDLSRVLRVPGTINNKIPDNPRPVLIETIDETIRYNPDDLAAYLVAEITPPPGTVAVPPSFPVVLNPDAEPPKDKFYALFGAKAKDTKPYDTWHRTRADKEPGTGGDASPSSYDFSLALYAARAQWTDQEIADLIIAFRRTHGLNTTKALRRDYLQRTIYKARATVATSQTVEILTAEANTPELRPEPQNPAEMSAQREEILSMISAALGIKIVSWKQIGRHAPTYLLSVVSQSGNATIEIGDEYDALSQSTFRARIAAYTPVLMPRYDKEKWDRIIQWLMSVRETDETDESEPEEIMRDSLPFYLSAYRPCPWESRADAVTRGLPIQNCTGEVLVSSSHLAQWLSITNGGKFSQKTVGLYLRRIGGSIENVRDGAGRDGARRRYWRIPQPPSNT